MIIPNTKNVEILTPNGFESLEGLQIFDNAKVICIYFTDGTYLYCTPDHYFYRNVHEMVNASALLPLDMVLSKDGCKTVLKVTMCHNDMVVYDILKVGSDCCFYANDVLVSNCEFISVEETLINSVTLARMQSMEPIEKQGQIRWFKKPSKNHAYIVALDPSLGTGGDYAAIEVFELPDMIQVAEWQHNHANIQKQIVIMSEIVNYLSDITGKSEEVYYSVENNSLGEAALVVIKHIGEDNIRGYFLSEPAKLGQSKKYRKGFTTTAASKKLACVNLKTWCEYNKIIFNSKNLISELKVFVATGEGYRAKLGFTDDLVMATILAIRMANVIAKLS